LGLNSSSASFPRAVSQTVSKFGIAAEALGIGSLAAERRRQSEHIVNTHLTARWQRAQLSGGKTEKGSNGNVLHFEGGIEQDKSMEEELLSCLMNR